jgi:phospholipid/cholesterol/gamma-HCH transport system substrate-binding protein
MNERVMQFRIGMFVIVAGLVLIMMIVWFGESPTILRDQVFLKAHFFDAPGVADGIPVRRSGIKIGEVSNVEFDDRPGTPDGVIITLSLDRKSRLRMGSVPKITRALIGDVAIEMTPGTGTDPLPVGETARQAPLVEGEVAADPGKMMASAAETLVAIQEAAKGLGGIAKKVEKADELIATFIETGKSLGSASNRLDTVLKEGGGEIGPTMANLRATSDKLNKALDDKTVAEFKTAVSKISSAGAKLDASLTDLKPLLADLGAPVNSAPTTNFGQSVWRANRIFSDVGLLTRSLSDGRGGLNPNGSIQQLFLNPSLYDNWNKVGTAANNLIDSLRPVVASLRGFADRVNRDPSALTRGALQR